MDALSRLHDGTMLTVTATGLQAGGSPRVEECRELLASLNAVGRATNWIIGDVLNVLDAGHGEEVCLNAIEECLKDVKYEQARQCMRVSRTFIHEERDETMSWTVYRAAATDKLDPGERSQLLLEAKEENLSTREVGERVKEIQAGGGEVLLDPWTLSDALERFDEQVSGLMARWPAEHIETLHNKVTAWAADLGQP